MGDGGDRDQYGDCVESIGLARWWDLARSVVDAADRDRCGDFFMDRDPAS